MNDEEKHSPAAQWLGTVAIDGARVGPFELRQRTRDVRENGADIERYDVYLDSFETPLLTRASAAEADLATREFLSRLVACAPQANPLKSSSGVPGHSSAPFTPPQTSRRRRSKGKKRRIRWRRLPSTGRVLGLACLVALASLGSYYLGTTQIPAPDSGVVVDP